MGSWYQIPVCPSVKEGKGECHGWDVEDVFHLNKSSMPLIYIWYKINGYLLVTHFAGKVELWGSIWARWRWQETTSDFFTNGYILERVPSHQLTEETHGCLVCILFRIRQGLQVSSQNLWNQWKAIYKHSYDRRKLRTTVWQCRSRCVFSAACDCASGWQENFILLSSTAA